MAAYEVREVIESPVEQGSTEEVSYVFNWEALGTPTSPTIKVLSSSLSDVSSTYLAPGSPTVSGFKVTTQLVKSLVPGNRYRLDCEVTIAGNKFCNFCWIKCKR